MKFKTKKDKFRLSIQEKVFGWIFLLTGIFCIISSLYAWGEGWLFSVSNLDTFLIPMADLVSTGPLSLITAYGILKRKAWGVKFGILTAGIYIFGSVLVFITLVWRGSPYAIQLIIPSVFGFVFAISFFNYSFKRVNWKTTPLA